MGSPDSINLNSNAYTNRTDYGAGAPGGAGDPSQSGGVQTPPQTPGSVQQPTELQVLAGQTVTVIHGLSELLKDKDFQNAVHDIIPEIDPAELSALSTEMADLEALVALLTLENDEEQAKEISARIDAKVKEMETNHEKTLKKVQESIDKAVEQQKLQDKNKILGWIMMGLAILAAAISIAATAVTGGGSLAIVGCVLAGVSALFSMTNQILDATGVIEKSINERAEKYAKEHGCSLSKAKQKLMKDYQIGMMVAQCVLAIASISCGITSMVQAAKAAADVVEKAMTTTAKLLTGLRVAQMLSGAASLGTGITSSVNQWKMLFLNKDSADSQAAIKELKALLEKIQNEIDEEQEKLENILMQIRDILGVVLAIFTEPLETADQILDNTQPMS